MTRPFRNALGLTILIFLAGAGCDLRRSRPARADRPVVIGSKKFTESVLLGEMTRELIQASGIAARHRAELGGTRILWNALQSGDIDLYPEYTGTLREELLAGEPLPSRRDEPDPASDLGELRKKLAGHGVILGEPLGFNNTYAIGVKEELGQKLGLRTVSDLNRFPELVLGLSNEFKSRADGWPGLRERYGLPQKDVRGMDHDFAYRALESGDVQAIDLYTTDAEIAYYHLRILTDDRHYFPTYQAVFLYRADLPGRSPLAVAALNRLRGAIDAPAMIAMNARAKKDHQPESEVARDFLAQKLGVRAALAKPMTVTEEILRHLREHLSLVGLSMVAAIAVAIPLGILAAQSAILGQVILSGVGIIQTLPSLAVLVMLIRPLKWLGLPGIGNTPAVVALFLYSLLPIVRNTHAGLQGIGIEIRESAEALGLTRPAKLRRIELPLAMPSILSGIKIAAVTNVGFATLGALVGAGGFGQPILTGIRLDDYGLILQGALPAAGLAMITQLLFDLSERWLVPRGLRL